MFTQYLTTGYEILDLYIVAIICGFFTYVFISFVTWFMKR